MLKRLGMVLAILLVAIPAFSAVLIDFNTLTLGSYGAFPNNGNGGAGQPGFDTPLATLGVNITGNGFTSRMQVINNEPGETLPIGGNYLVINTVGADPVNHARVTVDFQANGSTWFARGNTITLDLWDTNPSTVEPLVVVNVFDENGNYVEAVGFTPIGDTGSVAVSYTGLVSRIEFVDQGGDGHVVDNLAFTLENTAVPEPASVALIGSGLLLAGLLRRPRA